MKQLKFAEPLPQLILKGIKDTTWRINDDKNISLDDELSLCDTNQKEFARAELLWIKETSFGKLTQEDIQGHEKFSSEKEMLETYSNYYNQKVTLSTKLKVFKFRLLKEV